MFHIKKYAASGVCAGEVVKEFDTLDDASDYLETLKAKREANGYEVDTQEDNGLTVKIELTRDDLADVYVYEAFPAEESEANFN